MEILYRINWVDIVIVVMGIRIIFMAMQTGFVVELLNGLAAVAAVLVSCHFFTRLAAVGLRTRILPEIMTTSAFVLLCVATLAVCWFIKNGLFMHFTVQAQNALDKWGAAVLSCARVLVAGSLLIFGLMISGNQYLKRMSAESLTGTKIVRVAPAIYTVVCDRVVTPLFPHEKKNPAVADVTRSIK